MSARSPKQLILEYFEAISGKEKPAALVETYVADAALIDHIALTEASFPRYRMEVEDIVGSDDRVAVRFTAILNQASDYQGVPSSGQEARVPAIAIYRIEGDKIVEHWLQLDAASMVRQLTAPMESPVAPVSWPIAPTAGPVLGPAL